MSPTPSTAPEPRNPIRATVLHGPGTARFEDVAASFHPTDAIIKLGTSLADLAPMTRQSGK